MGEFFGSVWWFVVALGLLVAFHEFGHFWVARRLGVRVLRFSIGFGAALWSRRGADGTEYALAAIPLGGYVKMLDEREGPVEARDLDRAFNRKPLGARTAIVAAGPAANLLFAVLAFWLMFMVGIPEIRALFDAPEGLAAEAGMRDGDRIVAVDGAPVETLIQANIELMPHALDREPVAVTVLGANGARRELVLPLDRLGPDFSEERLLEGVGLKLWEPELPPVIGEAQAGRAAAAAGLRAGDRIVSIDGHDVASWQDLGPLVQEQAAAGMPLELVVERDGTTLRVELTPERDGESGRYLLGIAAGEVPAAQQALGSQLFTVVRHGPVAALGQAFAETWRMSSATLGLLRRMVTGEASLRNLSGPISIAQFANDHARAGLGRFLFFLGVLSLSLAILNILPIPLLDGGHLLYYFIEWLKGSPVSEQVQIVGQYIGLAALAGLVSLTFYNDILRLVS